MAKGLEPLVLLELPGPRGLQELLEPLEQQVPLG